MSEQIRGILRRAKEIHQDLKVSSLELEKYLQFLKVKASEAPKFAPCGGCLSEKMDVRPALQRAFSAFTWKQRAQFYLKNVLLSKQVLQSSEAVPAAHEQLKSTSWYFFNEAQKEWQTKLIEINFSKLIIKLRSSKEELDMHNYILRASKKKDQVKSIVALESVQTLQLPQTIRISNFKENFEEFSKILHELIDAGLRENIERMTLTDSRLKNKSQLALKLSKNGSKETKELKKLNKQPSTITINIPSMDQELPGSNIEATSAFRRLQQDSKFPNTSAPSTKNLAESQELKFKTRLFNSLSNSQDLQVYRKNVLINIRENRLRKIYEYKEQDSALPFEWFSDNFMISSCFRRWKKTLRESRTLSFSKQSNSRIFYELHEYRDQSRVSYIYKREKIVKDGNCLYFIDTPVNQTTYEPVNGRIQYVIWKFQRRYSLLEIKIEGKVAHGNARSGYPSIQLTDEFLGSMDCICVNLNMTLANQTDFNINSVMFEEEFLSQIDIFKDVPDSDQFYTIPDEAQPEKEVFPSGRRITRRPSDRPSEEITNRLSKENAQNSLYSFKALTKSQYLSQPEASNLLKFRHPMEPFPKGKPILKKPMRQGQHPYFQSQFKFTKDGEMISINQEKLKAQSNVLKSVLKSISKNIFSGKSILNISLPVTVFSVESNLSLICKSYAFGPLLLERAVKETDPVHRMKHVATFVVSVGIAYLQMDKPFNPILGETFQAIFDGCLVYGQQVSHHPPISSTFMVGRGYKLYGSFEAKVNMSLNSATGSNDGILHITFDQKDLKKKLYKVIYPPGEVTGLTFGTRKVATTGKCFILDTENRIYLQLNYNRHKGTTEYCKFYDGIEGKIVQLSNDADVSKIDKINKKSITKQYGTLCGRWGKEIYFQDELLFDSWVDFSHAYEPYPCPLQSDAYFRQDLKCRVANDYEAAQTAKEMMEDLQRKDRALRKKYTGSDH